MKIQSILLVLIFTIFVGAHAKEVSDCLFGIKAKREQNLEAGKIQAIQIFGERCSGTTFLSELLNNNLSVLCEYPFGWKHFPCWYDTPFVDRVASIEDEKYCYLKENENYLFVIIFRDPYDWLRSFFRKPHHVSQKVSTVTFGHFLQSKWFSGTGEKGKLLGSPTVGIYDLNPWTGKPFKNVLELRSARINNMLKIENKVDNVYYINYEVLRDHPEEVINEISQIFHIPRKEIFIPITTYKNDQREIFRPKKYFSIKEKDLQFLNSHLDWETEKKIGYSLKTEF